MSSFDDDFESVLGGGGAASSKGAKKGKSKKSVKFSHHDDEDSGEFGGPSTRANSKKSSGGNPYVDGDMSPDESPRHTGGGYLGSGGVLKSATRPRGSSGSGGMVMPKGGAGTGDALDALSGGRSVPVPVKRALSKDGE